MSKVTRTMNAVITTGEYTDNQGQQKKSYMTIGTLFVYSDGGLSLKLDAVPVGNGNISFYEREPKKQGYQQQQATPRNNKDDVNRHNIGGNHNQPSQQQQYAHTQGQPPAQETFYDKNGNPIPL